VRRAACDRKEATDAAEARAETSSGLSITGAGRHSSYIGTDTDTAGRGSSASASLGRLAAAEAAEGALDDEDDEEDEEGGMGIDEEDCADSSSSLPWLPEAEAEAEAEALESIQPWPWLPAGGEAS
jgi:hypothetical protein